MPRSTPAIQAAGFSFRVDVRVRPARLETLAADDEQERRPPNSRVLLPHERNTQADMRAGPSPCAAVSSARDFDI
jgi:hypothetical protein